VALGCHAAEGRLALTDESLFASFSSEKEVLA
jgi:hypothetical protein